MNRKIMTLLLAAVMVTAIAVVANARFASAGGAANTNGIKFNKHNFSNSLNIDNKYFSLVPGTTFAYEGMKEG